MSGNRRGAPPPPSTPSPLTRRQALRAGALGLTGVAAGGALLTGCGTSQGGKGYPNRPIQVIVAYAPGGGTDVGARILQPYLEDELGVELQIINRPGGGGWVGWSDLAQADPDGYTIGFINTPNFISGYLDPRLGREDMGLKSFAPIGNQVTDYGAVAIHPDEDRFTDIGELIEYSRESPLVVTSTGVGSDDHFASLMVADQHGAKFDVLHNEGSSDGISALLGRNVDVVFANVGELTQHHENGELKVVAVQKSTTERSPYLPDVPTLAEAGYGDVDSWSSRGLAAPPGLPADILDTLVKACDRSIQADGHVKELGKQGLEVDYRAPEDYTAMLRRDEKTVQRLGEKYIWGEELR